MPGRCNDSMVPLCVLRTTAELFSMPCSDLLYSVDLQGIIARRPNPVEGETLDIVSWITSRAMRVYGFGLGSENSINLSWENRH